MYLIHHIVMDLLIIKVMVQDNILHLLTNILQDLRTLPILLLTKIPTIAMLYHLHITHLRMATAVTNEEATMWKDMENAIDRAMNQCQEKVMGNHLDTPRALQDVITSKDQVIIPIIVPQFQNLLIQALMGGPNEVHEDLVLHLFRKHRRIHLLLRRRAMEQVQIQVQHPILALEEQEQAVIIVTTTQRYIHHTQQRMMRLLLIHLENLAILLQGSMMQLELLQVIRLTPHHLITTEILGQLVTHQALHQGSMKDLDQKCLTITLVPKQHHMKNTHYFLMKKHLYRLLREGQRIVVIRAMLLILPRTVVLQTNLGLVQPLRRQLLLE